MTVGRYPKKLHLTVRELPSPPRKVETSPSGFVRGRWDTGFLEECAKLTPLRCTHDGKSFLRFQPTLKNWTKKTFISGLDDSDQSCLGWVEDPTAGNRQYQGSWPYGLSSVYLTYMFTYTFIECHTISYNFI